MPSFTKRSKEKELLDRDDIPFEDIRVNMKELDLINSRLGGHRITLKGFGSFIEGREPKKKLFITEIGCGGGDNLRVIRKHAEAKGIEVDLTGVDINPECIQYAASLNENQGIKFIKADYIHYTPEHKPDIIFSSLFCHHFSEPELVYMIRWMKENAALGFFINDLHRHFLAYYSIALLTKLFSKSYLVKHDAPLSVRRGFKKQEWENLVNRAGADPHSIEWCWAFRWLIIHKHD
jgi:2-polyprenyl-3-methyl-5-hydroxy-6-metoxy-1,4-benzoquinol methylase